MIYCFTHTVERNQTYNNNNIIKSSYMTFFVKIILACDVYSSASVYSKFRLRINQTIFFSYQTHKYWECLRYHFYLQVSSGTIYNSTFHFFSTHLYYCIVLHKVKLFKNKLISNDLLLCASDETLSHEHQQYITFCHIR